MVRLRVYGFFSACTGIRTHGAQAENQLRHKKPPRKGNFWAKRSVLGRRVSVGGIGIKRKIRYPKPHDS